MGDFAITDALKKAFEERNIEYFPIRVATPNEFYEAIGRAKKTNEYGSFVTQHSVDEYKDMCLFITTDGQAGIAVTKDNNIVSIFNGGERKGALKTLLPVAIQNGGNKLDNYNSEKLSSLYELYGFNPISKVKFNNKFAPTDWNYERDGNPDIVFWIHNGDSAADVITNWGSYFVSWDNVIIFDSYEEAEKYRDELINRTSISNEPCSV